MKERPILFNPEMVRAILEGRKTQTRRVIKPQPECESGYESPHENEIGLYWRKKDPEGFNSEPELNDYLLSQCPHGQPGDRLWVRETWCCDNEAAAQDIISPGIGVFFRATEENPSMFRWKPSIHMPRWASRITLEITNVRVERVQDISEEDAISEGMMGSTSDNPAHDFYILWDEINEARGFGWVNNPLVWVIEFKKVEKP